eukprot:5432306-Amphidinium_carterae.1
MKERCCAKEHLLLNLWTLKVSSHPSQGTHSKDGNEPEDRLQCAYPCRGAWHFRNGIQMEKANTCRAACNNHTNKVEKKEGARS